MAIDPALALRGVIRGKVIELDQDPGLAAGTPVEVYITLSPPDAGTAARPGWTDDPPGLDRWLEETRRLRKLDRRELPP